MADLSMHDIIFVGGGLANGLIAWRLRQLRPELDILILEQDATLGGNHTWSFHDGDVTPDQRVWLRPFIAASWAGYQVRFPAFTRDLPTGYHSVLSQQFHDVLHATFGDAIRCHSIVTALTDTSVTVNGEIIQAKCVLDGRGYAPSAHMNYAWQKFVGLEVELTTPHNLLHPIIMDATVEQTDGYRFIYTLPFSPTHLLIEDTRYSDRADIDDAAYEACIRDYAARQGWAIASIIRREKGVLPITLSGDIDAFWHEPVRHHACTGLRAGLFHPTTGYSLPQAAILADRIAALDTIDPAQLRHVIQTHAVRLWRGQSVFRILNRMLFYASSPALRYRVLQRFYRLPATLIARFYAGRLTMLDIIRILSGKPPVPVFRALRALFTFKTKATS